MMVGAHPKTTDSRPAPDTPWLLTGGLDDHPQRGCRQDAPPSRPMMTARRPQTVKFCIMYGRGSSVGRSVFGTEIGGRSFCTEYGKGVRSPNHPTHLCGIQR